MSDVHVEKVGDNVVVCREMDHKPECYWFKYGNTEQLAMVLGAMNVMNCDIVREIAQKAGISNVEDFVSKYCDSKPHPELYGVKPSSEEERIRAKVLLTVKKDGDAIIVCAGEYNCVRIKSCEPQHLARAIKLLNIHDVMHVLSIVNCMESYGEVMRILSGEGYV